MVHAVLLLLVAFIIFNFAIRPSTPNSVLVEYMGIVLVAVALYISSNDRSWKTFQEPIFALLLGHEPWIAKLRWAVAALIPLLVGVWVYSGLIGDPVPPAELRQVHPAPATSIQFREKTIPVQGLDNPFWKGPPEIPDPVIVAEGKDVYVTHCVFCHGDTLKGGGLFARGLNPAPADFTDPATITQLQQSYLFWRITKGGRGLPLEAAPWNSAMPAWENELEEEEIWKVIVYLYDAAGPGVNPRTWD